MNIQLGSVVNSSWLVGGNSSKQITVTVRQKSQEGGKITKSVMNLPKVVPKSEKNFQRTLQQIAKRIAEGKNVSMEERRRLQAENPALYAKAVMADRMRESLEKKLKNAKSKTAQASAVSQAIAQAIAMGEAEEKAGVPVEENGMPLYMDAIRQAIKDAAHPGEDFTEELYDIVDVSQKQFEEKELIQ